MSSDKGKSRRQRTASRNRASSTCSAPSDEEWSRQQQPGLPQGAGNPGHEETKGKSLPASASPLHCDEEGKALEDELAKMESELGAVHQELAHVQREREILEGQRRVLKAVAPTNMPANVPATASGPTDVPANVPTNVPANVPADVSASGPTDVPVNVPANVSAKRPSVSGASRTETPVWRGDHIVRDHEDLAAKTLENCELRSQVQLFKEGMGKWEARAMELEYRLRSLENHKSKQELGSREAAMEQQQMLAVLRQKYAEAQDEMEEMRALIQDQAGHLEGYRNKYLLAQQQVVEQRRQMDQVEAEQDRITDQVQQEMHRVKVEFEEKLQVLAPLPDILKSTQSKLLESEHNCAHLSHELADALERLAESEKQIECLRAQKQSWLEERQLLVGRADALERKCCKLKDDIEWYKQGVEELQQVRADSDRLYKDTALQLASVRAELVAVRDQASCQRHQADAVMGSFQTRIGELEQELAASRASASAARKEKEEIQHQLQAEVSSISERYMNLQSVVDVLKNNVLNGNMDKTSFDTFSKT